MTLLTTIAELDELGGGRFRQSLRIKPIAWRDASGNLRRIVADWADGDALYPHVVTESRLRVLTAANGDRRICPVPGDLEAWFSISRPFVKVGGVWQQPSLGTFTRTANMLQAETANVLTRLYHGGHFVKAGFLLKNGWVPEDRQFAFRVGLNGLTRDGGALLYDGAPVMHLRRPVVYDYDNSPDVREIPFQFVQLSGAWYALFTLPDLAGMSRPVVDPTLDLQPDDTTGKDTQLYAGAATTNYGTDTENLISGDRQFFDIYRSLIQFDLSSIPADATCDSAELILYQHAESHSGSGSTTHSLYRLLRAWVETEATWNIYSTGNNWGTAGANNTSTDREATSIGDRSLAGTEGSGDKSWTLTAAAVQDWWDGGLTNNGMLLKSQTEADDGHHFRPSGAVDAGDRPEFIVEYTEAGGGGGNPWHAYAQQ